MSPSKIQPFLWLIGSLLTAKLSACSYPDLLTVEKQSSAKGIESFPFCLKVVCVIVLCLGNLNLPVV